MPVLAGVRGVKTSADKVWPQPCDICFSLNLLPLLWGRNFCLSLKGLVPDLSMWLVDHHSCVCVYFWCSVQSRCRTAVNVTCHTACVWSWRDITYSVCCPVIAMYLCVSDVCGLVAAVKLLWHGRLILLSSVTLSRATSVASREWYKCWLLIFVSCIWHTSDDGKI